MSLFLKLANDASFEVKPLIETPVIKVFGTPIENDSTALKTWIQFDENQNVNVGLKDRVNIRFVTANPAPKPDFVRDNVVTEANVTYLSTIDNNFAMPVSVDYKPKAGKTGEEMKEQFLKQVAMIQTCHNCIKAATSSELILNEEVINICQSKCETCVELNTVCNKNSRTKAKLVTSNPVRDVYMPISSVLELFVLVLTLDCKSGNKKAFEFIEESKDTRTLPPQFVFICLPDAVHVAKTLKCGFADWMILLLNERSCLSKLHTIRDGDPTLKRILSRDSTEQRQNGRQLHSSFVNKKSAEALGNHRS